MVKSKQPVEIKIKNRIYGKRRGWVFTQKDFSDLGGYFIVRNVLLKLEEEGFIRRIAHGLYDYPKNHKILGALPPSLMQAAEALARRDSIKIQPSGALAANMLGLSEQVPAKIVYLTDSNPKVIRIKNQELRFRKTTPKRMVLANTVSGLVIEALLYLGKEGINSKTIEIIKRKLSRSELARLRKDSRFAPAWVQKMVKVISDNVK